MHHRPASGRLGCALQRSTSRAGSFSPQVKMQTTPGRSSSGRLLGASLSGPGSQSQPITAVIVMLVILLVMLVIFAVMLVIGSMIVPV